MKNIYFRWNSREECVELKLEAYPWRWHALVWTADLICAMSGHRFCFSLVRWAYEVADKHDTARLCIPVEKMHWQSWAQQTGAEDPSWWWTEDEDEDAA